MVITRAAMAGASESRSDPVGMGAEAPTKAEMSGGMKSRTVEPYVMTPAQVDAAHGRGKAASGK